MDNNRKRVLIICIFRPYLDNKYNPKWIYWLSQNAFYNLYYTKFCHIHLENGCDQDFECHTSSIINSSENFLVEYLATQTVDATVNNIFEVRFTDTKID